jgi:hypothetical protein
VTDDGKLKTQYDAPKPRSYRFELYNVGMDLAEVMWRLRILEDKVDQLLDLALKLKPRKRPIRGH